jgi:hypothetical protein
MPKVDEIAPDLYRISVYVPEINLQFNHFLVKDDEPLLFHTGLRRMFPLVREASPASSIRPSCAGSASATSNQTNARSTNGWPLPLTPSRPATLWEPWSA